MSTRILAVLMTAVVAVAGCGAAKTNAPAITPPPDSGGVPGAKPIQSSTLNALFSVSAASSAAASVSGRIAVVEAVDNLGQTVFSVVLSPADGIVSLLIPSTMGPQAMALGSADGRALAPGKYALVVRTDMPANQNGASQSFYATLCSSSSAPAQDSIGLNGTAPAAPSVPTAFEPVFAEGVRADVAKTWYLAHGFDPVAKIVFSGTVSHEDPVEKAMPPCAVK